MYSLNVEVRKEHTIGASGKGRRHICPQHELGTGCMEGGLEACVLFSPALEHGGGRCCFLGN